jgi:phage shock protein A
VEKVLELEEQLERTRSRVEQLEARRDELEAEVCELEARARRARADIVLYKDVKDSLTPRRRG